MAQYQLCPLLLGIALSFLIQSNAQFKVPHRFYVKPTFPANASCHDPDYAEYPPFRCQELDFYLTPGFLRGAGHITLILLKGIHKSSGLHWEPGVRQFIYFLQLLGSAPANEIIVESIHPIFKDMKAVYMENMTVSGSVIEMRQQNAIQHSTNFTITNCIFRDTTIQMEGVNLLISNSSFYSSPSTALYLYSSILTLSGEIVFANNTGAKGGALALIGSMLKLDGNTRILFENNSAHEVGGAIYVDAPKQTDSRYIANCFFEVINYYFRWKNCTLSFNGNSAIQSGDHVYGAAMRVLCVALYDYNGRATQINYIQDFVLFNVLLNPDNSTSLSTISGDPLRVCICDHNSRPQCADISKIFSTALESYPGEAFTITAAAVGDDFGTTVGNVYANIYASSNKGASIRIEPPSQVIDAYKKCANLTYTILSSDTAEVILYLTVSPMDFNTADEYHGMYSEINDKCESYEQTGFIHPYLLRIPVFMNVTLLECPPGFTLQEEVSGCDCHPALSQNGAECVLDRKMGYIGWNTDMWLSTVEKMNSTAIHISKTVHQTIA